MKDILEKEQQIVFTNSPKLASEKDENKKKEVKKYLASYFKAIVDNNLPFLTKRKEEFADFVAETVIKNKDGELNTFVSWSIKFGQRNVAEIICKTYPETVEKIDPYKKSAPIPYIVLTNSLFMPDFVKAKLIIDILKDKPYLIRRMSCDFDYGFVASAVLKNKFFLLATLSNTKDFFFDKGDFTYTEFKRLSPQIYNAIVARISAINGIGLYKPEHYEDLSGCNAIENYYKKIFPYAYEFIKKHYNIESVKNKSGVRQEEVMAGILKNILFEQNQKAQRKKEKTLFLKEHNLKLESDFLNDIQKESDFQNIDSKQRS